MTTAKKRTTIWIDPPVLKQLKLMGVDRSQPIGNVIEALVDFAGMGDLIKDETFRRRWNALLETAFANAGRRAVWEGDPPGADFDGGQGPSGDDIED
ncbi:hypothetical protein LPC08_23395 [Roseomonas sp. OT10]|uniref:hypothetical protein n=1 Tax=Roseomonas cutis TaxID=2897332 RepID=UPI001E64E05F|nr:hypothetical protein [Roseomonas sp. OT10]UFN48906.1 hypothetical protein LPC08_23395 [Roseomonas sp. OT10]